MLKRFFLTIAILPIAMPLLWSDDKSSNRGKETPVLLNTINNPLHIMP